MKNCVGLRKLVSMVASHICRAVPETAIVCYKYEKNCESGQ